MKFSIVADIYYGLFDGCSCQTVSESDSLDEIEREFDLAVRQFTARHINAEFCSCHLIVTATDDSGNEAWSGLSHSMQTRLAKLDVSIE